MAGSLTMPNDSTAADLKQEATRSLHRSHGSFELALAPMILALLGLWLDRTIGTVPVFMLVFAFAGIFGTTAKIFYTYKNSMGELSQRSVWSGHASSHDFRATAAARAAEYRRTDDEAAA